MKVKKCNHCQQYLSIDQFYQYGAKIWAYCRKCEKLRKRQQLIQFKKCCLEYKQTSECTICGYNKTIPALDFHHIVSSSKDFTISQAKHITFNDTIKQELDKCIVVCSNCHRELHADTTDTPFKLTKKTIKPEAYCKSCNKKLSSKNATMCRECYNIKCRQQSQKPSKQQLLHDIQTIKYFTRIGKKYNVSDNTIRKWCTSYNIDYKGVGDGN